jgi:hypothetical protein
MGFLSDIKDKIFGRHDEPAKQVAQASPAQTGTTAPRPTGTPVTASTTGTTAAPSSPAAAPVPPVQQSAGGGAAATTAQADVDVGAILDEAVAKSGQTLDWRKSIVDLMKALGIDSSLSARKELAKELDYTGDTDDSATMNIWLHKQVLQKLAQNGGKVPADLL